MQLDVEESTPAMTWLIDFTPELQLAIAIKLLLATLFRFTIFLQDLPNVQPLSYDNVHYQL